ncbi:MAG: hypothetical protein AAF487_10410 [Bacteroidota bacterium]
MGLSNSIIAIKGDHLDKTAQIFEIFGYVDRNNDKQYDNWEPTATYLFENYFDLAHQSIAIRGIWTNNGWTIICDPEMVDTIEDDKICQLSSDLDTPIITFMVQSTSGSYWFATYDKTKQRHFFAVDGQIAENIGDPLPEEKGLNINESIFIDDIINLANKFGVDFEVSDTQTTFTVKELGYSDQMQDELNQATQPTQPDKRETPSIQVDKEEKAKKPWWKF